LRRLVTKEAKDQFLRIIVSNRYLVNEFEKSENLIFDKKKETYLEPLQRAWNKYFGKSSSIKVEQGHLNMILSHYAQTPLDDLPKGSVGYVLGRKKAFNKHINKVFEKRGFTWEREDPNKATFFIVGDILTEQDNKLNEDLKKPIVMDIVIENEYHHELSGSKYIKAVDETVFNNIFRKSSKKDIKILSTLLKFVHADALSNNLRTRLVLYYLDCVGYTGYDYSDKEHKGLIRLMRRLTLPQHQFLLEPKFANSYKRIDYSFGLVNYVKERSYRYRYGYGSNRNNKVLDILTSKNIDTYGYIYMTSRWSRSDYSMGIPMEEDTLNLYKDDIIQGFKYTDSLNNSNNKHITGTWETKTRKTVGYKGSEIEATCDYSFTDLRMTVTIKYLVTKEKGNSLLQCYGAYPTISNSYGSITTSRFNPDSTLSAKILSELDKDNIIEQDIYSEEIVDTGGWKSHHYAPFKGIILETVHGLASKLYGERCLEALQ
jgi:hypothetical protein